MRILNVLAEGQYLDHASRSLELRFGFYESSRHVSGLVKLHFERGQGTAYTMRPILGAITAAARRDRVALFIAAFLHTSWFSLAASTIYMCFRSLLRLCTHMSLQQTIHGHAHLQLPAAAVMPGGSAVWLLDALLAAAQAAAACAYVVALVTAARLPAPHSIGTAALRSIYHDVNADARVLLPAKQTSLSGAGAAGVAGMQQGQDELSCGVMRPSQLWSMPAWALPDSSRGVHAFVGQLVRLLCMALCIQQVQRRGCHADFCVLLHTCPDRFRKSVTVLFKE